MGINGSVAYPRRLVRLRGKRLWLACGAVLLASVGVGMLWVVTPPSHFTPLHCTAKRLSCTAVAGRVLYVQRTDPDGDGDAHLVLLSQDSLTRRWISVVKIERDVRPPDLPGRGRWVSAIGQTYSGEKGETNLNAARVREAP